MQKVTCDITGQPFQLGPEELEAYRRLGIPGPTSSLEERFRRLLAFRNEEQFFWRKCDRSGQKIYSIFPPNAPFPVIAPQLWWEEDWDPLSYGAAFDPARPFLDQLIELWWKVPRPGSISINVRQSAATHNVRDVESSFVLFNTHQSAVCFNSVSVWNSSGCADCYFVADSELCYECVHCYGSRNLRWSELCEGCEDSWFLSNCLNCRHCLFCTNLEGKEYHVLNSPVSPEQFEKLIAEWSFTSRSRVELAREQFEAFLRDKPLPQIISDHPNTTSGNYLKRSEQVYQSFECVESSSLWNCHGLVDARDCVEGAGFGGSVEQSALFVSVGANAARVLNCVECWNDISNVLYSTFCSSSRNLFGCVGLRDAEYCVLNRQLSRTEYSEVTNQIIAQLKEQRLWGKFLPPKFAGFAYNQSSANKVMPLSKITAKLLGYRWQEGEEVVRPSQLLGGSDVAAEERFSEVPDRLEELSPEILPQPLYICELTGRPFRILREELSLYQLLAVPPPARCFEQRHQERLLRLSPPRLHQRTTGPDIEFSSAFPPQWRRPVLPFSEWAELSRSI